MDKPIYEIVRHDQGSALTREQLLETLSRIPLSIRIKKGHDLSLIARLDEGGSNERPILNVEHLAQLIVLRPQEGNRLADAAFGHPDYVFIPRRIMDELTGGGTCCSYRFSTGALGLPYDYGLTLDIHKLG